MQQTVAVEVGTHAERRVQAFRLADIHGPAGIAAFLPAPGDADYLFVLSELVRADVQHFAAAGIPRPLAEYRRAFPALDSALGDRSRERYTRSLTDTPPPPAKLSRAALSDEDHYPLPGEEIDGYLVREELGRGATGRVYLAEECRLSARRVVLKLTSNPSAESETLARLQHTNIVPIQTAFRIGGRYAIQMPYFGRQTLADLIEHVRTEVGFPVVPGRVFTSTAMRASTDVQPTRHADDYPTPRPMPLPAPVPTSLAGTSATRRMLAEKPYPDAVVWLITRLADGLAHAHEAGLLHLDLKPANVLLSDDGQPMLLDFNLAVDTSERCPRRIGGTWPYMPPEQMLAYARKPGGEVTERSDLFALGVIFYELLTARLPFPAFDGKVGGIDAAVAVRRANVPDVRTMNPAVSPAVAAIVRKLLAPNPADRYPSAAALVHDLERHASDRPLVHAGNPSLRERFHKWRRRHPHTFTRVLAAGLFVAVVGLSAGLSYTQDSRDRDRAERRAHEFLAAGAELRSPLATTTEPPIRRDAEAAAERWLAESIPTDKLTPTTAVLVGQARGELMQLLAHAATLDRDADRAANFAARAAALPAPSATGATYLTAVKLIADGDYRAAIPHLTTLTETERDHYAAHFALAYCYQQTGQPTRALERYQVARAVNPADPRPAYNRGLILSGRHRYKEAEAEYTKAIERRPGNGEYYWSRAFARRAQNDLHGAIDDLTAGMAVGMGPFKGLQLRAKWYDELGNATAAATDAAAAKKLQPVTAQDFTIRGYAGMHRDPQAAMADFTRATQLDPTYLHAWTNLSRVLAEDMNQPVEAETARRRAVELSPTDGTTRGGLAVLLARAGHRAEAHIEMARALDASDDPRTTLLAANTYALTSATNPDDLRLALTYLRSALRDGIDPKKVLDDKDMAEVLKRPEFRNAVDAAARRVQ